MNALTQLSMEQFLGLQWLNNLVRYFLIAGMTYLIFWKWGFERLKSKFLYAEKPVVQEIRREMFYSILTTLIFLLPTVFLFSIRDWGISKIYCDINEKGLPWYAASFAIVFHFS